MFGIGMPELLVIFVVALVVLGPKRLPEVARTLGKAMAEFRRQSSDIIDELQHQMRVDDEPVAKAPTPKPKPPSPAGGDPPSSQA